MPLDQHDANPVFVVGFYRSGTSLLHALLNQHPRIALMYECDVLKLWPLVQETSVRHDWLERLEYWNHSLSRHRIDAGKISVVGNRATAAMELYRSFAMTKNAPVVGEKSPYYHNCLPRLAADFPHSRIIVLWRSPGEILQSIRKASQRERFFAGTDWQQRVRIGMKEMASGCAHLRSIGHSLLEIEFPSLLGDQARTLGRICVHLDIEFDSRMMSLEGADTSMLPAGEHHRNVRGGKVLTGNAPARTSLDHRIAGAFESRDRGIAPRGREMELTLKEQLSATKLGLRDTFIRMLYAHCPVAALQYWRGWRCRRFTGAHPATDPAHGASIAMPVG